MKNCILPSAHQVPSKCWHSMATIVLQEKVPNLGWLIALLTVSPKHKWGHAAVPLLMETLDRNVLWSCKAKESLVQRYRIPEHCSGEIFPFSQSKSPLATKNTSNFRRIPKDLRAVQRLHFNAENLR